jgi:hypothetical protein
MFFQGATFAALLHRTYGPDVWRVQVQFAKSGEGSTLKKHTRALHDEKQFERG